MLTRLYCGIVARMKSEEGATAVEYGVMVALIAVGIIAAVTTFRNELATLFNTVATKIK